MPRRDRGALRAAARELLAFLNKKTNRNFQAVDTNLDPLIALLRKGRTPEQIRGVIAMRVARWLSDPDMSEFLRPSTLFKPRNFENYLGQLPASAFEAPQNA